MTDLRPVKQISIVRLTKNQTERNPSNKSQTELRSVKRDPIRSTIKRIWRISARHGNGSVKQISNPIDKRSNGLGSNGSVKQISIRQTSEKRSVKQTSNPSNKSQNRQTNLKQSSNTLKSVKQISASVKQIRLTKTDRQTKLRSVKQISKSVKQISKSVKQIRLGGG